WRSVLFDATPIHNEWHAYLQIEATDPHDVTIHQLEARPALAIHQRPVGAREVPEQDQVITDLDRRVLPRNARVVQQDVGARISSDDDQRLRHEVRVHRLLA